jgi:membrane peptidoglycan carboxypeptidase
MASSTAKVLSAHARHVTAAKTSDAASAEATDVTSTKAAHVASAKAAADVTSTTTTVSSATATAGLGISGKKAAGKHGTCQNHHHSSSHDILLLGSAGLSATGFRQTMACAKGKRQRRDGLEMETLACALY